MIPNSLPDSNSVALSSPGCPPPGLPWEYPSPQKKSSRRLATRGIGFFSEGGAFSEGCVQWFSLILGYHLSARMDLRRWMRRVSKSGVALYFRTSGIKKAYRTRAVDVFRQHPAHRSFSNRHSMLRCRIEEPIKSRLSFLLAHRAEFLYALPLQFRDSEMVFLFQGFLFLVTP